MPPTTFRRRTSLLYKLFILRSLISLATANQACPDGKANGPDLSLTRNETDTGDNQDEAFLDLSGSIDCHGAIKSWQFSWIVSSQASCHNVTFQVWRPLGGDKYMLIGQTQFSPNISQCEPFTTTTTSSPTTTDTTGGVTDTTTYQDTTTVVQQTTPYDYPEREQIEVPLTAAEYLPVQPGDLYGWIDVGAATSHRRIPFESASSGSGQFSKVLVLPSGSATGVVGDVTDWSTARTEVRNYSLNIIMTTRSVPYFISPDPTCNPGTCQPVANLTENRSPGEFIYKVVALNDYNYNDVINPDITYHLTADTCSAFDVDALTGQVHTTASLDYEAILASLPTAPPSVNCTLTIVANEGPPYSSDPVYLVVNVIDVNEPHTMTNLPNWPPPIDVDVININDNVFNVLLSDEDDPNNWPTKNFTILQSTPSGAPFGIRSLTLGTGESYGGVLVVKDMTYWQHADVYALSITASDGFNYDGPSELQMHLTNIRQKPIISNLPATVYVSERSTNANDIYTVVAQAMPTSRNDLIEFSVSNVYPSNVDPTLFGIHATTGEVSHSANPEFDYFGINPYYVEVVARYVDGPSQESDPQNLTVMIQWTNKEPYFNTTDPMTSEIKESQGVGSYLPGVLLTGHDRDLPVGDWIHYSLTGFGSHLFRPDNVTNHIYVIRDLILDPLMSQVVYDMDLFVIDSHGAYTNVSLSVTVTDVNNNPPITDQTEYEGQVIGDALAPLYTGVTIATTDEDGPSNALLTYVIIDDDARLYFEVNTSGDVITKQPIPYSVYKDFVFTVFITDNGKPAPLNTTVQVAITITGSDVNAPVFSPLFDSLDLRIDTETGSVIYTVYAYDNDSFDALEYLLWTASDYYSVSSTSGHVTIRRPPIAYEKEILYVNVKDDAKPAGHYADRLFTLRIDTYNPRETLVDVYLMVPLSTFTKTQDEFLAALNRFVPYWDVRIESTKSNKDSTIVTVYAVESALPDEPENEMMDKVFIKQDDLFGVLSKNLEGDPNDGLLAPEFAPWQPYKVRPYAAIWIVDTPGGITLLTFLCLLATAALITLFVLLAKKNRWCCYKRSRILGSKSSKIYPQKEEYDLRYNVEPRRSTIFTTNVPPSYSVPFPSRGTLRTSLSDVDDYNDVLPPVAVDDKGRPLPRARTGTAA